MIIGFKTGPKTWNEGRQIVEAHGATFCEIWFNVLRADEYVEPLSWFTDRDVGLGLHYWGMIDDLKPNYATTNEDVRSRTLAQMKHCIDLGAQYEVGYVNLHPSARQLEKLDVDKGEQSPVPESTTPEERYQELLIAGSLELHEYASSKGVLLTIETIPSRENYRYHDRSSNYDPGNPTLNDSKAIAEAGCNIANDLTHTTSAVAPICAPDTIRECMATALDAFVEETADSTYLVHANTMVEPFDGTDTHDGVRDVDFANGVFPDRDQVVRVLSAFKHRDDVFIVPEPKANMVENYQALEKLAEAA